MATDRAGASATFPLRRQRIAAFYAEHGPFQHIATRELCAPEHVVGAAKTTWTSVPAVPTSVHHARSPRPRVAFTLPKAHAGAGENVIDVNQRY
jgi:hypothetical protein